MKTRKTCRICQRRLNLPKREGAGRPSNAHPRCRAIVARHILTAPRKREARLPGNAPHRFAPGEEFAEAVDAHSLPARDSGQWGDE